jgi:hypothetical protein
MGLSCKAVQPQSNSPQDTTPPPPLVTVIMVSWNCIDALRLTLEALKKAHSRERMEVQVVDAGSRDGCGQVDTEFADVHVQRMPRNFGRTRARNIGLKTAQSELTLLLEPGVEVAPGTIAALAAALDADPLAVAAVPALADEAGRPLPVGAKLPDRDELAASCKENREIRLTATSGPVEYAASTAILVRQRFLRGMNYFDERRYGQYGAELELCWQIRCGGKRILVVDAPATVRNLPASVEVPRPQQALLAADRVAGTGAYIFKHHGFGAGIGFRLGQLRHALGLVLREPGYGLRLLMGITGTQRINGDQGGVLG